MLEAVIIAGVVVGVVTLVYALNPRRPKPPATAPASLLRNLRGHAGAVHGLAFRPDGNVVASTGLDGTIRLQEVDSESEGREWTVDSPARAVAFDPSGGWFAYGADDGVIRLRNTDDGEEAGEIRQDGTVTALAVNGDNVASADSRIIRLKTVRGETRAEMKGHRESINSLAFHGGRLASASVDGTVRLWNPETGEQLESWTGHSDEVRCVSFSRDGRMVTGGIDRKALVWKDGAPVERLEVHAGTVDDALFLPDGRVVTATTGQIRFWKDGKPAGELRVRGPVRSLAASPDGSLLVSGSEDGTVSLWRVA